MQEVISHCRLEIFKKSIISAALLLDTQEHTPAKKQCLHPEHIPISSRCESVAQVGKRSPLDPPFLVIFSKPPTLFLSGLFSNSEDP